MIELSLPENQQISTLNTNGYITYVRNVLGEDSLTYLFQGILDHTGKSINRTYLGQPIDLEYFVLTDNWIDNKLSLQLFKNLDSLGIDLLQLGKTTVTDRLMRKSRVVIGMVQLQGMGATFNGVNKVNSLYNRTKDVSVSNIHSQGGKIHLAYRKGIEHNEHVTTYNIGSYLGVLSFLGYQGLSYRVVSNKYYDNSPGATTIEFNWEKKPLINRLAFFIGSLISKRILKPYLKSSQFIHDYHENLLYEYQYQISRKNQLLRAQEEKYQHQLKLRNQKISKQQDVISRQQKELSIYLETFKIKAENWLSKYACQPNIAVKDFAKNLHLTEKTLNRRLDEVYGKSAKTLIAERKIKKAKTLLAMMSVTDVSNETGFNSSAVFSRAFKKATGLTPKQFKTQNPTKNCPKKP